MSGGVGGAGDIAPAPTRFGRPQNRRKKPLGQALGQGEVKVRSIPGLRGVFGQLRSAARNANKRIRRRANASRRSPPRWRRHTISVFGRSPMCARRAALRPGRPLRRRRYFLPAHRGSGSLQRSAPCARPLVRRADHEVDQARRPPLGQRPRGLDPQLDRQLERRATTTRRRLGAIERRAERCWATCCGVTGPAAAAGGCGWLGRASR